MLCPSASHATMECNYLDYTCARRKKLVPVTLRLGQSSGLWSAKLSLNTSTRLTRTAEGRMELQQAFYLHVLAAGKYTAPVQVGLGGLCSKSYLYSIPLFSQNLPYCLIFLRKCFFKSEVPDFSPPDDFPTLRALVLFNSSCRLQGTCRTRVDKGWR